MPLFGRQVSDAGRAQILAWADELGLLSGKTDFTGDGGLPGGVTGQIELTVDGRLVALTGLPDATSLDPKPGSPEAFGALWQRIANLPQTLPGELGPEQPYTPRPTPILVGQPPAPQDGMTASVMDWPLDTPLATFGGPVANNSARCGLVEGEDAATLTPALAQANQLTMWTQDPEFSAAYGLTVRPIVAGENPCAEIFGLGGLTWARRACSSARPPQPDGVAHAIHLTVRTMARATSPPRVVGGVPRQRGSVAPVRQARDARRRGPRGRRCAGGSGASPRQSPAASSAD